MAGIVKDPALEKIGQILDIVKDVQTTLDNMNKTLNRIAQDLLNIQVNDEWNNRNNKATTMSTNWNNFNTNYTERFQTYISEYQAKINTGIKAWWEQASHEGVYVLMTKKYTEQGSLTYSKKKYSEGLPATSDINNETVNTAWSIGIPAEYMPNTRAVTFNVDTYRDDFKKIMVTALGNAIKDNKLASNCGASVKSEYSGSSRQAMLESYADNVLNTVIYKIACEVMTANNSWVAQVVTLYGQYCDNVMQRDSGINAFLNYIYLTHAFEGEARSEIERFLDGMTAQAGFFGQFALTCAGQDSLQTTAAKEKIREYFTTTVTSIADRKAKAITGKNNYCYITGTVIEADTVKFSANAYAHRTSHFPCEQNVYTGCDGNSWEATVPSIVNSVFMPIIYRQYTKIPQGTKSFGEYLHKYGAQNDDSNKIYMTNYIGQQNFAFSEGIRMQAHQLIKGTAHPYFSDNGWYNIDVGTGSKVEQQYYAVHDKVVGDLFDSSNGTPNLGATICARAFYGENHSSWQVDEFWAFHTEGIAYSTAPGYKDDLWVYMTSSAVDIMKSTACHDLNGDEADNPENPFFAYDQATLTTGVSDVMGLSYENTSKDLTDIQILGGSIVPVESVFESGDVVSKDVTYINVFKYTGQPIEPAVTVFASGDVVSEDGYTVTYINNVESGDIAVIRVEGKGDYAGVVTRHFTITSANDDSSSSQVKILNSSSGGCNAMGGLFAAFGLAFVIRKFRRR